jgi:ABC-type transport system substrate-binding protein
MPGHSHRVAPAYDPDRARALLREAGYVDGDALGEIVLAYMDLWEEASCDVAAQLEAVGIRVRPVCTASDPELEGVVDEGAHHCFVWGVNSLYPDPSDLYDPRHPLWRRWYYIDERLEQLLTRAASLRDQDERLRMYREFERIWVGEQAAVVPLAYGAVSCADGRGSPECGPTRSCSRRSPRPSSAGSQLQIGMIGRSILTD